jgi:DNA repair exonuclease SbcCD ATPase subunit
MAEQKAAVEKVLLDVTNIGGISETSLELTPGTTLLTGRNATNRTSLLQAIMAALGSNAATLKGDADQGRVELTIGDTTYTREFNRNNGTVVTDGSTYLDDPTLADLFSFLLESNEARQAISREDHLHEIIMRPVDTEKIENQIQQRQEERDEIDGQIEKIDRLEARLPKLEEEKAQIETDIENKREEETDLKDRIEDIDRGVNEEKKEKEQLEEKIEEINGVRNEQETVRQKIDTQKDSLDALKEEQVDLRSEREDYEKVPEDRIQHIETEITRLQNRRDELNTTINKIQTVVEFNEDLIEGEFSLGSEDQGDDAQITDQLLDDGSQIRCWTCGNQTTTETIESMLNDLRKRRDEQREEKKSVTDKIDELNNQRRSLKDQQREYARVEERIENVEEEIGERQDRLVDLEKQLEQLTEEVETLETELERLQAETDQDSEILDLHKEANQIEVEIGQLENERDRIEENIANIEDQITEREQLKSQREEIQKEIENLRTQVENLGDNAIEQFNEHMEKILKILNYKNIDRVWIERTKKEVKRGRKKVKESTFDLHVVRSTDSGTVYEDTVTHLSESEREVVGLVFALSGYLAHEVYEEVPFMLIDSIEAIDSNRIAEIVDYFHEYADYLIVALLDEDAQALDGTYDRITQI